MKNNNRKAVKKLTIRSFKTNKKRNIFIFAAIFLTTFMLASVISVGMSFNDTLKLQNLRSNGSAGHVKLINIDINDIGLIKNLDFVSSVGVSTIAADVVFDADTYNLAYYDETLWKRHLLPAYMDVEGEYPEKENEIMLSRRFLFQMEITEPEIGMEIPITYKAAHGEEYSETFILSGFYTSYENSWRDPLSLSVSKAFLDKIDEPSVSKINASVIFKSNWNVSENIENLLRQRISYSSVNTPMNYNDGPPTQMIVTLVIIILFLMITGFLLIYNVLYISVSNDVRFFGLLKTVGTTSKQIRRIVTGQALRLCLIAIPLGTILAVLSSFIFVPMVLGVISTEMTLEISLSPYIYIGAPLLTLITTLIGAAAPAKKASRIAPIEAVRYTGQALRKKRVLTSTRGKPFLIALRNLFFRNKKRMITVFISLFLSLTLFMSVAVITFSMDAEQYLSGQFDNSNFNLRYWYASDPTNQLVSTWTGAHFIAENAEGWDSWDFESKDFDWEAYHEWLIEARENFETQQQGYNSELGFPLIFNNPKHKFDEKYYDRIEKLPGFISYRTLTRAEGLMIYNTAFEPYVRNFLNSVNYVNFQGSIEQHIEDQLRESVMKRNFISYVYGMDVDIVDAVKNTFYPPLDIEAFERGEIALLAAHRNPELLDEIKSVEVILSGGKVNFEVGGIVSPSFGGIWGTSWYAPTVIVSKSFLEQHAKTFISNLGIRVDDKYEQQALVELQEMTEHDNEVYMSSRMEEKDLVRGVQMFFGIIGGSIAGVIGLTGLLNFINVMSVGIMSRKKELAAMESVGMTKKQARRMLIYEGAGYAAVTLVLAGSIGNIIAINLYNLFVKLDENIFKFNYPYIPFIITALVILSVCLITPIIAYRSVSKATIVERLREME